MTVYRCDGACSTWQESGHISRAWTCHIFQGRPLKQIFTNSQPLTASKPVTFGIARYRGTCRRGSLTDCRKSGYEVGNRRNIASISAGCTGPQHAESSSLRQFSRGKAEPNWSGEWARLLIRDTRQERDHAPFGSQDRRLNAPASAQSRRRPTPKSTCVIYSRAWSLERLTSTAVGRRIYLLFQQLFQEAAFLDGLSWLYLTHVKLVDL